MKNKNDLRKLLIKLNDRSLKSCGGIVGEYDFGDFTLIVDSVSEDSTRSSAKIRVRLPHETALFPGDVFNNKSRETGARDFLARNFDSLSPRFAIKAHGINGGRIFIDRPAKELLETSAVVVGDNFIEVRFTAEIPHRRGKIDSASVVDLFINNIPVLIGKCFVFKNVDGERLAGWIETCEDADNTRKQLKERNLTAFIADGSLLPRRSPVDMRPPDSGAVGFAAPDELAVTIDLPDRGAVRGLGIPAGITIITGLRFQGKSTLLRAVELGVYNHIPGDGREFVVTVQDAVGIRAEPGRTVERVDVSPFFGEAFKGADMKRFSTRCASAPESVAANIMEALEIGISLFLIDEDAVPAGMMGRDARMQELVPCEKECAVSLIDVLPVLRDKLKVSTIMIVSGAGDYLDIADTVIAMKQFRPYAVTESARSIVRKQDSLRENEYAGNPIKLPVRLPLDRSLEPMKKPRDESAAPPGEMHVVYGDEFIDVSGISQIVSHSQARAISRSLALAHRLIGSSGSLKDVVDKVMNRIGQVGLDTLSGRFTGDLAMFRAHELAAVINRLKKLKVK